MHIVSGSHQLVDLDLNQMISFHDREKAEPLWAVQEFRPCVSPPALYHIRPLLMLPASN